MLEPIDGFVFDQILREISVELKLEKCYCPPKLPPLDYPTMTFAGLFRMWGDLPELLVPNLYVYRSELQNFQTLHHLYPRRVR